MRLVKGRDVGFRIDDMPEVPAIFELIQKEGRISKREMYRTFNMGIGFCVVAPGSESEIIENIFKEHNVKTHVIGQVVKSSGVYIDKVRVD
jgi:phosphoribosylformylglycinamidine cyclo-ligase